MLEQNKNILYLTKFLIMFNCPKIAENLVCINSVFYFTLLIFS